MPDHLGDVSDPRWDAAMRGQPDVDRALVEVVLRAHPLIGPDEPPAGPAADVATAEQLHERSVRLGALLPGAVSSVADLRRYELVRLAGHSYRFLVSTMHLSQPSLQYVAELVVEQTESLAAQDRAFTAWPVLGHLLKATHLGSAGRLAEALDAVDAADRWFRRLRRWRRAQARPLRSDLDRARSALRAAVAAAPLSEHARAGIDDRSYAHGCAANELVERGRYAEALAEYEQELELLSGWLDALPHDARAVQATAACLRNRVTAAIEAEDYRTAEVDARRAMALTESLSSMLAERTDTTEETVALTQARFALARAATAQPTDIRRVDDAMRHGTAAIERVERLVARTGGRHQTALGEAMVLHARALTMLAEDADPATAPRAVAMAAQQQALTHFRSRRGGLSGRYERLLFAQVAFLATVSSFTVNDTMALAAATDFTDQMYAPAQAGLRLFPTDDIGDLLEELGFAEYVIARCELANHDIPSFAQHLRQAKDLLDRHPQPAEMAPGMVRIKQEIDAFLATHDRG